MTLQANGQAAPGAEPVRVRPLEPAWAEILAFYYDEAEMLDNNRAGEWIDLLADDLRYTMPVRTTRLRSAGLGFEPTMSHYDESKASMTVRVRKLTDTNAAWAEDPPSRTRRYVTNLRVLQVGPEVFDCSSYLLLLRSRWDSPAFEFLSCERKDRLRRLGESFEIASRTILVDQSTLGNINLALFL